MPTNRNDVKFECILRLSRRQRDEFFVNVMIFPRLPGHDTMKQSIA